MTVIQGNDVHKARLLTLRQCVSLECKGMKHSRGSVTAVVNREFGWRGTKRQTYDRLNAEIVKQLGPSFDRPYH